MTSKKNPKVTFEEIKESDDGLEDDPEEEEEENIGGFGHFISSQKLSDDSPPPPKIALNQQMSTFTLCSGEEIKSSKFARSDSNNSMKKIRNLEKEKRLLFEKKQYDIFDKNGNISQRYKNSFEANYDINSDYIFQIQSYFSRGNNSLLIEIFNYNIKSYLFLFILDKLCIIFAYEYNNFIYRGA